MAYFNLAKLTRLEVTESHPKSEFYNLGLQCSISAHKISYRIHLKLSKPSAGNSI